MELCSECKIFYSTIAKPFRTLQSNVSLPVNALSLVWKMDKDYAQMFVWKIDNAYAKMFARLMAKDYAKVFARLMAKDYEKMFARQRDKDYAQKVCSANG